jgi:small neutral amino acid transporter SnatA (MarC family)
MVLDLLLLGLVVAIEPVPISFLVLLIASDGGLAKGLWFLVGWVGCLVGVMAVAVTISGGKPIGQSHHHVSILASSLKIAAGCALLVIAYREYRGRHKPKKNPKWMSELNKIKGWQILGLSAFLTPQVVVFAAGATVLDAKLTTFAEYLVLMAFVVIGSLPYLAIVGYAAFWPKASEVQLDRLRNWLDLHRTEVLVGLFFLIGLWLVSHSIYSLASA